MAVRLGVGVGLMNSHEIKLIIRGGLGLVNRCVPSDFKGGVTRLSLRSHSEVDADR